jgi:hypothetical protein
VVCHFQSRAAGYNAIYLSYVHAVRVSAVPCSQTARRACRYFLSRSTMAQVQRVAVLCLVARSSSKLHEVPHHFSGPAVYWCSSFPFPRFLPLLSHFALHFQALRLQQCKGIFILQSSVFERGDQLFDGAAVHAEHVSKCAVENPSRHPMSLVC